MLHYNDHIKTLMEKLDFPQEAVKVFTDYELKLDNDKEFADRFDAIVARYPCESNEEYDAVYADLDKLSDDYGLNRYTTDMVFLMNNTEEMLQKYRERGIDEEIYWDTVADLKYKLIECMECEEVCGTFVRGWFKEFFELNRFALGRFQYNYTEVGENDAHTLSNGYEVKVDDPSLGFHIPSSGVPLTDEVRFDSYRKAHKFFRDFFNSEYSVFECGSWLLFDKHPEFLPPHSNILKFYNDFTIMRSREKDEFHDGWRIFGKDSDKPIDELPTNNSLQKAYVEWMKAGNKTGDGFGMIVFDGEKIVR